MALEIADRVKETTTTTSTGTYTLAGAVDGFQSFAAVGDGNTTYYACTDGTDYEVGVGSYTASGTTLSRVTILESSNSDAAVNWGAGTKEIFVTVPAEKYLVRDASGNVSLTGNLTVSGTVDGRDVSADGSKLDGIESGATADQTAAQIRAKVEAASDSNVFTDADHTKLNGIEANAKDDQTITAGSGLTGGGTGDVTLSHADTSSQASVNGSGRTYIQDITLDTYGHVTGLATATETVVNTDTVPNNATITISAGNALTGGGNFTTDQASNETITINHQDTSSQASVNNSGRTYIQDITLDGYGHVTGISSATETVTNTNTNQLTTFVVEDGDGTEVTISHGKEWKFVEGGGVDINWTDTSPGSDSDPYDLTISHADTSSQASVNNSGRTYIQDITLDTYGHITGITSATETVTAPTVNNATITISAGTDLTTGGNFTTNQGSNETITINHADTSTLSGTYGSTANGTKIDQITVDGRGHVTAITTGPAGYTTTFQLEDGDGTEVTISHGKEIKFVEGGNIDINWTDTSNGTDGDPYDLTFAVSSSPSFTDVYVADQIIHTGDTNTYTQFHAADQWRVVTGGAERLEVSNSQMLVNNDIRVVDDAGIHIQTDTNAAGAKITMSDNSPSGGQVGTIEYRHSDSQSFGAGNCFKFFGSESSMSFHVAGNGLFTGNVATAYSDERLKDFDGKIEGALDKLSQLNGYYYHANNTAAELGYDKEPRQVGVSAQEVEAVMPEVIAPAAINPEYKTVHYDRLVPLLIEAIKELKAEVEELKR